MKETIEKGELDFFYINSHVFYHLFQSGKAVPVAQMENTAGKTTTRSEVFVRKNSGIQTIDDLKGGEIAFVSPMGAGGYIAPRAYLHDSGLESGEDFKEVFTRNLSNSIHGVLLGDYDAAAMCGVNYELMSRRISIGDLKIIANSNEYPENLIAARSDLAAGLVAEFRQLLLSLNKTTYGKQVLEKMKGMKIKNFVEYDESMNDITRELLEAGHL